ncbi:MAG: DUF3460 family protein [Pseudomonadota bacterium]|nr:DUF3460 family protein [Pseudomonadota bacterium]
MMLPARHYQSDITKFIRELKADEPELDRDQQNGRAIWWDKVPQDLAERLRMDQGRVQQQAYVYQTSTK